MLFSKVLCRAALAVVVAGLVSVGAKAQSNAVIGGAQFNTIAGKVVEKKGGQVALGGVRVELISGGVRYKGTNTDPAGRYSMPDVERTKRSFAVSYSKAGYASSAREGVENDVYSKELDTIALVANTAAAEDDAMMLSALESWSHFLTVTGRVDETRQGINALRAASPRRFDEVLKNNEPVAQSLRKQSVL